MIKTQKITHFSLSDLAHHRNSAFHALHETLALDDAIKKATDMTSEQDTLIIVTADHSHTMSFGGSIKRGNPILGKCLLITIVYLIHFMSSFKL